MEQENETYRYPWARNLFFVVLYIGLLFFLWHFPVQSVRLFFRDLMGGFLYLLAGLAILAVTALLVLSLLPPALDDPNVDFEALEEQEVFAIDGEVLGVPALRDPGKAEKVWETLETFQETVEISMALVIDEHAGVVMVSSDDSWRNSDLLHDLSRQLMDAGFKVKRVSA
jgi:hypothetical protein